MGVLIGVVVLGVFAQAAVAIPGPKTFSYTGAEQFYTVPTAVTNVQIEAVGGNGEDSLGPGGSGLDLFAYLPVSPGHVLYAEVGAVGGVSIFGGGGPAGSNGGAGGGASDVRTCSMKAPSCPGGGTSSASRLVVASGAGGGGGSPPPDANFGASCGVGALGGAAWDGSSALVPVAGGTVIRGQNDFTTGPLAIEAEGGQATRPGAGGVTPTCSGGGRTFAGAGSGKSGTGASGGGGGVALLSPPGGGGGGGGGGYFGGGGGASGQTQTDPPVNNSASHGAGGAGGSSFFTSQATVGRGGTNGFYFVNHLAGAHPVVTFTPLIEIDRPTAGARYRLGQLVNAAYSCFTPNNGCVGTVPSGSPIDTSTVGAHTFQVTLVGSPPAVSTVRYTVDASRPSISIATPVNGKHYSRGQVVIASYSCSDPDGRADVASCAGPVASGHAIDTATAGVKAFTVRARDKAGNTATKTVHYTVNATRPSF